MSFFAELRRRNVFRMAGLYLVGAWLIVQVGATLLPVFEAPSWVMRVLVAVLAIGFLPALIFSWVFELTPDGLKREDAVPPNQSMAPQTARRLDRAIIVVLLLAVGYFAIDKFVLAPGRERAAAAAVSTAGTADPVQATTDRGIAVLPLANTGGSEDEQYFSDGLSENLITMLSQLSGLKVISRNSSFQFRDSTEGSASIGRKLGVSHLLEGSVRRLGDTVRINASLVLAEDGSTVWSERYDRPYTDLFKLQDEIATAVASALKAKIVDPASASVQDDRPPSGNLDAYTAFLKGEFEANINSETSNPRAMVHYREALRLDPDYAHAWASLAYTQSVNAGLYLHGEAMRAGMADARVSIDKALALAPESAYVQAAHSTVLMNSELRYVEGDAAAQRAVALSKTDFTLFSLGLARFSLGDAAESEAAFREALQVDPLSGHTWFWLSINLGSQGKYDEARAAIERNMELRPGLPPSFAQLCIVQVLAGQYEQALATANAMPEGNWKDIAVAFASQRAGEAGAGDRTLQRLIDDAGDGSAYQIAEIYALRDEPDQVFAWLEKALAQNDPGLRRLSLDPFISRYRDDPRFEAFRARLGLPALGETASRGATP